MVAADRIAVLSGVREYMLLERLETELVTAEELEASDRRQQVVALSQLAVYVFAALLAIAVVHGTTERQGTAEGESGIFPPPE